MSAEGQTFTQVLVAAKARRGRLSALKLLQPRPLVKPKVLCTDCRSMIGTFVANEPHVALTHCAGPMSAQDLEYYGCGVCRSKLVRAKKSHDFGVRWRLI